jgi:hypothetical protein
MPSNFFKQYFGAAPLDSPAQVSTRLWNTEVGPEQYTVEREKYQQAILEQYKIYVEMADRISSRRALANTFFITLNSAAFTLIGIFWKDRPEANRLILLVPFVVVIGLCLAWFWIVRAYRQLNSGKYVVIGALERRLPSSPYWVGEWEVLGRGSDKARYWPLTHLEKWVPLLFAMAYSAGLIAALTF